MRLLKMHFRYQYFLQLKSDIVDGRIPISIEQVVRLAALCLQGMLQVQNIKYHICTYHRCAWYEILLTR